MFLSENGSESEPCFFQPENSSTKNLMLKSYNKIDLLSRTDKACLTLLPSPSYHRWQEAVGPADLTFHGQNKRLLQQLSAGRAPLGASMGPCCAVRLVLADPVRTVHSKTNCLPSRLFTQPL